MLNNELLELIHQTVCKAFKSEIGTFQNDFNALCTSASSLKSHPKEFQQALFNYTLDVSKIICVAVIETLNAGDFSHNDPSSD